MPQDVERNDSGRSGGLMSKIRSMGKKSGGSKPGGASADDPASPSGYKRGGKVRKTGMALVHKGERVLTKRQQKMRGGMKGRGGRGKSR